MSVYDPRIDAYIAKSADFAKPVLEHVRELVHEVCPDVVETIKWGMPHFDYLDAMCGMASFKNHCSFGFWKATLLADPNGILKLDEAAGMGSFGKMTSIKDLPKDKDLKALLREAMRLNEQGIKAEHSTRKKTVSKPEIAEPDYFSARLEKNKLAQETWRNFAPSHRREYLEWITEAKTEATREKRMDATFSQLQEGKSRHWKYQAKKS